MEMRGGVDERGYMVWLELCNLYICWGVEREYVGLSFVCFVF